MTGPDGPARPDEGLVGLSAETNSNYEALRERAAEALNQQAAYCDTMGIHADDQDYGRVLADAVIPLVAKAQREADVADLEVEHARQTGYSSPLLLRGFCRAFRYLRQRPLITEIG